MSVFRRVLSSYVLSLHPSNSQMIDQYYFIVFYGQENQDSQSHTASKWLYWVSIAALQMTTNLVA